VRLLLFHPGAARIACEDCKKWIHNLETGERETFPSGPTRELLPLERPANVPTPCNKCPKGSPERAKKIELTAKNWEAYAHYQQGKAVGLTEAERSDPIVRRNFALLDRLTKEREQIDTARGMAEALLAVLAKR
jgi:hypothetical protein